MVADHEPIRFYAWEAPGFNEPVKDFVGLTTSEAQVHADERGLQFRNLTGARNYAGGVTGDRVNVWCTNDVVERAMLF